MDRQRREEKGQSQARQEAVGPGRRLPPKVREDGAQTGLSIFKINVNQNTVQETGMTGLDGRLSLHRREEPTREFSFSCTSAFLQYRPAGTLVLAQPQTLPPVQTRSITCVLRTEANIHTWLPSG